MINYCQKPKKEEMKKINILLILIIVMSFAASCSKEEIHPQFYYIKTINVIKVDGTPTNGIRVHKYASEISGTKECKVKFYIEYDRIHILKGKRPDFQSGYILTRMPDNYNPERDTIPVFAGGIEKGLLLLATVYSKFGHNECKFLGE